MRLIWNENFFFLFQKFYIEICKKKQKFELVVQFLQFFQIFINFLKFWLFSPFQTIRKNYARYKRRFQKRKKCCPWNWWIWIFTIFSDTLYLYRWNLLKLLVKIHDKFSRKMLQLFSQKFSSSVSSFLTPSFALSRNFFRYLTIVIENNFCHSNLSKKWKKCSEMWSMTCFALPPPLFPLQFSKLYEIHFRVTQE